MTTVDVAIADLLQEPIERGRAHLDQERVAYYLEHLDDAEPVTVFETDGGLLLADGYHRLEAARRLGRTTVRADVRTGSPHDALRFAVDVARRRGVTEEEVLAAIRRRS